MIIKIILDVIMAIAALAAVLYLVLLTWSPGKIAPYTNSDNEEIVGSISEIQKFNVGKIEQGMIIQGKSEENPVLLFLHGGPGNPEYVLAKEAAVGLEDSFTVCWWEQRGAGMSYSSSLKEDEVTLDILIEDTIEITNYLRERFGQDKIYIMGHSWGSFLGMAVVNEHPQLYNAYIGIGQISDQMESERLAYDIMINEADSKTVEKLKKHTITDYDSITTSFLMLRSNTLNDLGYGVCHVPKSKLSLLMPIFKATEYTVSDIYGYAMGSVFSLNCKMNDACYTMNLMDEIPKVEVPVFIFHGAYDRQVSYDLSKEYFDILDAPHKEFYTFENSAHSPFLEEPELFMDIINNQVLAYDSEV